MFELTDLLAGLALEEAGPDRFRAPNMDYYGKSSRGATTAVISDVIAGGQLLAQAIAAASRVHGDKTVKSIYAVFARSGRVSQDLLIDVSTIQSGRTMSTVVITFTQGDRPISTATLLMHAPDPDAIRHQAEVPNVDRFDAPSATTNGGLHETAVLAGTELA